jgi:urease accessory protein
MGEMQHLNPMGILNSADAIADAPVTTAAAPVAPLSSSGRWQGRLQLVFAAKAGATELIHSQTKAPLKVQRPFYPEGPVCHSVILHTAGGMVGGDRLDLSLQLQSQAQTLITTAAAGKIYRSNGPLTQQQIQIDLAAGACLEWLPQETIVFDQAHYRQDLRVNLAPEAHWLGWEITRFGRSARGEKFVQGNWRSQTEVWQADRPVWVDRQWIPGNATVFHSPHGLANCPVVGTFAYIGQPVDPDLIEQARSLWSPRPTLLPVGADPLRPEVHPVPQIGVSRLPLGMICRYRGSSNLEVRQWFCAVWHLIRLSCLKRPACYPRVWGA